MTKPNYTHIEILLDESGSMAGIKDATLEGLNSFLLAQKELPGQASIGLSKFSKSLSRKDVLRNCYAHADIKQAPELRDTDFTPDGYTPLYDSICQLIDHTGQFLTLMSESARPDKVLFVIITDGLENASVEYTVEDVKRRIQRQSEVYKWQFIYLGANQDAVLVGGQLGIARDNSLTFRADAYGTTSAYAAITHVTAQYRAGGNFGFTDKDREEQA